VHPGVGRPGPTAIGPCHDYVTSFEPNSDSDGPAESQASSSLSPAAVIIECGVS
jgi:hypothetical protein